MPDESSLADSVVPRPNTILPVNALLIAKSLSTVPVIKLSLPVAYPINALSLSVASEASGFNQRLGAEVSNIFILPLKVASPVIN